MSDIDKRLADIESRQSKTESDMAKLQEAMELLKDSVSATQTITIQTLRLVQERIKHDENLDLN